MRKALIAAALLVLVTIHVRSGEFGNVFLPDLLPGNTIFCTVPPESGTLDHEYSGSLFHRIGDLPEMGPFLRSFEESRRELANDVSRTANVSPQLASELVHSRLGLALINLGIGRDGKPTAEFAVTLTLKTQADRNTIFSAVMALLNRPEIIRMVLENQGIDPNLPLKTLAQEETLSGYPPILRIGPNIRIASLGNTVLIYHGPGSEGIRKIFDAAANPASSLTRLPSFQAVYRGTEATRGMSFLYINVPRLTSILDTLNMGHITRATDALGFSTVQALGLAGGYQGDGVRHSLYLHVPGGDFAGLMASLVPMPQNSPVGMEGFGAIIPSAADAYLAVRVDMPSFTRELQYLLNAFGAMSRPGGMGGFMSSERILGVPLGEIINSLGGDIVIRPHDDTQVVLFNNVNATAFEQIVARMEQTAGARFSQLNVGGYIVRYFNRRASLTTPLAPAFCLIPRQDGTGSGVLYMATHPQAVVSLIQETAAAREPLSQTPDYQKVAAGVGSNYSLYYYNNNRDCYRRVYNFLLPVAALWASSSRYPVDTGLLPTAGAVTPGFFGCAVGIRKQPEGMLVQAYSPIGFNALPVILADKLVLSNPIIIGYTYAAIERWVTALPTW